ncbi:MAG: membrane protein insertase YidC [candidate division WOR-3 bacterium]
MDNDQKRTLTAFLLIIVILLVWSFIAKPTQKVTEKKESILSDTVKTTTPESENLPILKDTIVIDKDNYRINFSSAGAGIKSFYLKKYDAEIVKEGGLLFSTKISDSLVYFSHYFDNDSIVFYSTINNKLLSKTYYFNENYGFTLKINYPDKIEQVLSLKSGLNVTEKKNQNDDLRYFNVYVKSKTFTNITKEIKDQLAYKNGWDWIALRTKYFALIINNIENVRNTKFYKLSKLTANEEISIAYLGCAMSGNTNRYGLELFADSSFTISVLVLPVKPNELAGYKKGYEQIASGGIWGPIEKVIIFILNFFYSFLKNYGFAIMIFALLFKIIFFPLSRQMLISQQQMQLLQPELKKIQEKYKNDPQALNREMMHLYKVYKVNPFSGCLPLLIQFPIFIALYQVLSTAIEFRRAPFMLWIVDLSLKDPYYILPIAMGVLMLIQSLMTTIDPRQRFMVIMMPLVMIFVFLNFPSGLQLYWFTYNILSILENLLIKKKVFR